MTNNKLIELGFKPIKDKPTGLFEEGYILDLPITDELHLRLNTINNALFLKDLTVGSMLLITEETEIQNLPLLIQGLNLITHIK